MIEMIEKIEMWMSVTLVGVDSDVMHVVMRVHVHRKMVGSVSN